MSHMQDLAWAHVLLCQCVGGVFLGSMGLAIVECGDKNDHL